jgi:hypothetical protein
MTTTPETTRPGSARKVVGTLAVIGAAAAVAGLGSYAGFTESTSPVDTQVDTGVVSIELNATGATGSVPFAGGLMLAGDSRRHLVDLVNNGDTALGSITLTTAATRSSILDTDVVNGLQLTVASCTQPWTVTGDVYSCGGTTGGFYSGPIVANAAVMAGAASLTAGGVDHLLMTAALPSSASGDAFENATSSLTFVFTGTQRGGSAR